MASLTQWTWVWASSRSWWWTGKPGGLQSMGSQRVRHNWATELNWLSWSVLSHSVMSDSVTPCSQPGSFVHGDSLGKNTGVDRHAILQGIYGIKPRFPVMQADSFPAQLPGKHVCVCVCVCVYGCRTCVWEENGIGISIKMAMIRQSLNYGAIQLSSF